MKMGDLLQGWRRIRDRAWRLEWRTQGKWSLLATIDLASGEIHDEYGRHAGCVEEVDVGDDRITLRCFMPIARAIRVIEIIPDACPQALIYKKGVLLTEGRLTQPQSS